MDLPGFGCAAVLTQTSLVFDTVFVLTSIPNKAAERFNTLIFFFGSRSWLGKLLIVIVVCMHSQVRYHCSRIYYRSNRNGCGQEQTARLTEEND